MFVGEGLISFFQIPLKIDSVEKKLEHFDFFENYFSDPKNLKIFNTKINENRKNRKSKKQKFEFSLIFVLKHLKFFGSEKYFPKNFQKCCNFFPLNRFSKFWYLEKANESLSNKHLQLI